MVVDGARLVRIEEIKGFPARTRRAKRRSARLSIVRAPPPPGGGTHALLPALTSGGCRETARQARPLVRAGDGRGRAGVRRGEQHRISCFCSSVSSTLTRVLRLIAMAIFVLLGERLSCCTILRIFERRTLKKLCSCSHIALAR